MLFKAKYTIPLRLGLASARWLAFIDADEFFVPHDESWTTLPELLKKYETYGGLAVNWRLFGSSGHITRPKVGRR